MTPGEPWRRHEPLTVGPDLVEPGRDGVVEQPRARVLGVANEVARDARMRQRHADPRLLGRRKCGSLSCGVNEEGKEAGKKKLTMR